MELHDAQALALRLMTEHGLTDDGWTFTFDKATSRMGVCKFGPKRISLSRHYTEHATVEQVTDTILHEIAHALVGPYDSRGKRIGHGWQWKVKARALGATPKACGRNPYLESAEVVSKKLAAAADQTVYRIAHHRFAGKTYRLIRENKKTVTLLGEDGREVRVSRGYLYKDGEPAPTAKQMRETAQAELERAAREEIKGKPIVRVNHPAYKDRRFALVKRGTARTRAIVVDIENFKRLSVAAFYIQPETAAQRMKVSA